jgi:hypothetical protein
MLNTLSLSANARIQTRAANAIAVQCIAIDKVVAQQEDMQSAIEYAN